MAAGDLTTLADVKAWLNTTGTFGTTDDALLTRLITAAGVFVKNWLSRDIVVTNYTELRDGLGWPSSTFSFANFPVTAVCAVNVAGVNIPPIPQTSGTLTTSAPTVAGNPTLTFTAVPSWVVQGLTITDPTTADQLHRIARRVGSQTHSRIWRHHPNAGDFPEARAGAALGLQGRRRRLHPAYPGAPDEDPRSLLPAGGPDAARGRHHGRLPRRCRTGIARGGVTR